MPERFKEPFSTLAKEVTAPPGQVIDQALQTPPGVPLNSGNETDLVSRLKEMLLEAQQPVKREPALDETMASLLLTVANAKTGTNMFRREFKIQETVGACPKETLNYISLLSQIGERKARGYNESEIVMAVRKAVSPGTPMRTYLDSNNNMSLDEVVAFIRTYLKEKPASELFHTLTNLSQKPDEDAQTFVLRGLELREKVIKSSAAEGSIRFDSGVVHDVFRHSIRTSLESDQIRMRIDPSFVCLH